MSALTGLSFPQSPWSWSIARQLIGNHTADKPATPEQVNSPAAGQAAALPLSASAFVWLPFRELCYPGTLEDGQDLEEGGSLLPFSFFFPSG